MEIERNLREVQARVNLACERTGRSPDEVTLVAVTKNAMPSAMRTAFRAGVTDFGENRVQEAKTKLEQLADMRACVTWHLVGHLQTNKVKTAAGLFDIIHSVDSLRLAQLLSRQVEKSYPVLIQVNVAEEAAKWGLATSEVFETVREIGRLPNIEIKGLMTIAPLVSDPEEVRPVFRQLRELRDSLGLKELSMGMTDDFEVAIEEGATIIRVGRAIFGERKY